MYGRKRSIDDYIDAIAEHDRPALTKQDIADAVGVSRQTVHNHAEELEADPRVESGQIGKATVYWLAREGRPDDVDEAGGGDGPRSDAGSSRLDAAEDVLFDAGTVLLTISGVSFAVVALMLYGVLPPDLGVARAAVIMLEASIYGFGIAMGVLLLIMLRYSISYWAHRVIDALRSPRTTYKSVKREIMEDWRPRAPTRGRQ